MAEGIGHDVTSKNRGIHLDRAKLKAIEDLESSVMELREKASGVVKEAKDLNVTSFRKRGIRNGVSSTVEHLEDGLKQITEAEGRITKVADEGLE